MEAPKKDIIVKAEGLRKVFKTKYGDLVAVDDVDFSIRKGEIYGLVGESGSGKSTIGSMLAGIYGATAGKVTFKGKYDISKKHTTRPKALKKEIQLVFQDPGGSLNPRHTIRQILEAPFKTYYPHMSRKQRNAAIDASLAKVGLPLDYLEKFPLAIGGGEKQLVCAARALAAEPSFIVLDEPTSALDVSIQAKITNKLIELQRENDLSYLFITHNLCLVRNMCDRLGIMYLGRIVEEADTVEFFRNPLHPYTKMLLASIPVLSDEEEALKPQRIKSTGEIPSPLNKPSGCSFHPRCPFKTERCTCESPAMRELAPGHTVACHNVEAIEAAEQAQ